MADVLSISEPGALAKGKPATYPPRVDSKRFSPEIQSWVDNCIVPILVKRYLANLESPRELDPVPGTVPKFDEAVNLSCEVRK
jgi:hypothetical protein